MRSLLGHLPRRLPTQEYREWSYLLTALYAQSDREAASFLLPAAAEVEHLHAWKRDWAQSLLPAACLLPAQGNCVAAGSLPPAAAQAALLRAWRRSVQKECEAAGFLLPAAAEVEQLYACQSN